MRMPKRGEKGFTLIELLIVVAILGILAAVIVPNVSRFFGSGVTEARKAENHSIQLAVASMMTDTGAHTLTAIVDTAATRDMAAFPIATAPAVVLFSEYIHVEQTQYWYSVSTTGTVTQYTLETLPEGHPQKPA